MRLHLCIICIPTWRLDLIKKGHTTIYTHLIVAYFAPDIPWGKAKLNASGTVTVVGVYAVS